MKKLFLIFAIVIVCLPVSAQPGVDWQLTGNNVTAVNWFGSLNNQPLSIRSNNTPRMLINNLGTGNAAGRIAMGNNLLAGFIPRSRLHLHHDDVSNISLRFTNLSTGTNPGDGFEVGYHAISPIINRQYAELNNWENTTN